MKVVKFMPNKNKEKVMIYEKAIQNAKRLMKEKTNENKAPSWLLTELAQEVGNELAQEFGVDKNVVSLTLYLQHLVFNPIIGGEIQKNHPNLSANFVIDNQLLEKWNIPIEDRSIILDAIRLHHHKEVNPNLTIEVIKNAECQKFVTVEGALIWLHELGLRGIDYEKSKELVFYKMNQKKNLLTLEKCISRAEESCKKITEIFESSEYSLELKELHRLGLEHVPYEETNFKL